MRALLRLGTVLAVFLGVSFVQLPISQAVVVHETLADRQPVGVGPVTPPFAIDDLGVLWDTGADDVGQGDHGPGEHGAVRFRVDGEWTSWQPLIEDGATAAGQWASALVPGGGADSYQVRGIPADAVAPRAVAINTSDGRPVETGRRARSGANAMDSDTCVSRGEWGAQEELRFDGTGNEIWPAEFYPVQTMTVHHTATENKDPDPAARVRAIYRYHTVDRGWGDIGYHYLIDESGKVYEGRWSSADATTPSKRCDEGGDGADFAHDAAEGLVTAGHTGGYNNGNMGVALLGNFTTSRKDGAEPAAPAVDALEGVLAEFATRHLLQPEDVVQYENPVDGARKTVNMISGHQDWTSTECPGARLYDDLPALRAAVADRMAPVDVAPEVAITSPANGETLQGTVLASGTASDVEGLTQVEVSVRGAAAVESTLLGQASLENGGWSLSWVTGGMDDGSYELTATATDTTGQTTSHTVAVRVDNVQGLPTVSAVSPASAAQNTTVDVVIYGDDFQDAAAVELRNGDGTQPVVSGVDVGADGTTIMATFSTGKTPGRPVDRPWDVVVTQDGDADSLEGGFTVLG